MENLTDLEKFKILEKEFNRINDKLPKRDFCYTRIEYKFFTDELYEKEIYEDIIKTAILKDNYGGEAKGEDYWSVWYFPLLNIYVRFNGWYTSDDGPEYYSMSLVYPIEVVKTEYVEK